MRATLIAISIALIIGGLYLIGFELMWAASIDTKFVLFVIVGVASTTLGGILVGPGDVAHSQTIKGLRESEGH